jgi:hypothetical protein
MLVRFWMRNRSGRSRFRLREQSEREIAYVSFAILGVLRLVQMKRSDVSCCNIPATLTDARAWLSRAGTGNSSGRLAAKPPGPEMLSRDERPFEVPRLAAGFMVQAGIASRDEFEFFRDVLHM